MTYKTPKTTPIIRSSWSQKWATILIMKWWWHSTT